MSEALEQFARATVGEAASGEPRGLQLVAEEDVLGDRQTVDDVELLIHRRDPEIDRGLRIADRDRFAVPDQFSLVGWVDAREDLDERRLAGAVLAEQAMHLARPYLEIHALQCPHPPAKVLTTSRTARSGAAWSTSIMPGNITEYGCLRSSRAVTVGGTPPRQRCDARNRVLRKLSGNLRFIRPKA